MTSFPSALVHCLTLAQSSWEKPADVVAEAEKAKGWEEKRARREAAKQFYLPSGGALGARALFKGFKQEEWSNQCSENAAFLTVPHHPGGGKTEMQEIHGGPGNVTSQL